MESPISRLAAAEQQLLEQSGVGVFADLMLAETNLSSFCHTHSAEVEPLLHTTTDVGSGGRSAALDFAVKLLSRTPLVKDGALEQALRAHFGVGTLAELGWSHISELRASLRRPGVAMRSVGPPSACILAAGSSFTAAAFSAPTGITVQAAVEAIEALPPLADIAVDTQWQTVFLPSLGPLTQFLAQHGLPVLEVCHKSVVKLEDASLSRFGAALQRLQPEHAVALACSLCVKAGELESAPTELMRDQVVAAIKDIAVDAAIHLVLGCTSSLQLVWPLRAHLFACVFLEALERVVPQACRQLAVRASARELSALRAVARELDRADLTGHLSAAEQSSTPLDITRPAARQTAVACVNEATTTTEPLACQQACSSERVSPDQAAPTNEGCAERRDERSCEELCAFISSRFGSGLDIAGVDDQTRRALHELRGGFQRSIHRLAEELYAGTAHFVLELVQNADDNTYAEGVTPALCIQAGSNQLRFDNNESGFTEKNVLALCSISESTKQISDPRCKLR